MKRLLAVLLGCVLSAATFAGAQASLDETSRTLRVGEAAAGGWTRTFPAAAGPLVGPVSVGGRTWLGVGPQLYAFGEGGDVLARLDLPADAAALDASGGEVRVTVRYGALPESFTVASDALRERVVYPPLDNTTLALARLARGGLNFDPLRPPPGAATLGLLQARVARDPTNPFSHAFLAVAALQNREGELARRAIEDALARPVPFFVSVQLARYFDAVGLPEAADRALASARQSWAALGYDPALPVSREALRSYGDPLGYLELLLADGNLLRAEAWLRFLRDVSPRFEGYREVYDRYIALLDAQNRVGEAYEWRAFSRELSRGSLYGLGPNALLAVRDVSRWATFALLLAIAATALALGARAWRLQGRDLAPLGGRWRSWALHPLSRLRRILLAYWGFGEKLALVALFASLLVALSAWTWSARTFTRAHAPALNFGTYGGAWFYDGLERLGLEVAAPEARFVRGLSAQLDGDTATARSQYALSGGACAANNLGALFESGGDEVSAREQYRAALALDPNLSAPAYNLQLAPGGFEANFQRAYRPQPRLCYPSERALYAAVDGALSGELGQIARNPWSYLARFPSGLPRPLQWLWVLALLFVSALSVLWLFVPRASGARDQGRPWRFRALALLFPGVAFLDVAWGLVLLLTWGAALTGAAAALGALRFPFLLDLRAGGAPGVIAAVLVACYVLNAFFLLLDELRFARARRARRPGQRSAGPPRAA